MKGIPDNTIDLVLTDPPYGYSFMGKDWDKAVPSVDTWKECLRILKPGAFCFVMSAPRQDVLSRMMVNLEDSGFRTEFRTDFTSIYWTYASGFPKAGNIGKMVDKRLGVERDEIVKEYYGATQSGVTGGLNASKTVDGSNRTKVQVMKPKSSQAKALDGSYTGYQPKPAVEVIIVCMKPLNQKTFVGQALDNGKGITWLDDCRVPYADDNDKWKRENGLTPAHEGYGKGMFTNKNEGQSSEQGRFPANLLISNNILNDKTSYEANNGNIISVDKDYDSRYFSLDEWDVSARNKYPFLIVPKASKAEKNKGCEMIEPVHNDTSRKDKDAIGCNNPRNRSGTAKHNHHPTVKPLKLMRYLITLATRENDIVLDPFNGSGTTCVAGLQLNRQYIGIDMSTDYVGIAKKRLAAEKEIKQQRLL